MKRLILNFVAVIIFINITYSQEGSEKKVDKPVRFPWDSEFLIDNQTTLSPTKKTLDFIIQHRFGLINKNGISDLFGIYAPGSNIRLGLYYTPLKNLTIGYGITKKNMYNDFQAKWVILKQTRSNRIPVALALFGDFAIDGRSDDEFGTTYKFSSRFSYFFQLIISRKVSEWFSVEATGSYTHYNMVAKGYDHDNIGIGFNGQIKFSPQSAIIIQYDIPLLLKGLSEQPEFTDLNTPKPNFGFGYQVTTSSHSFQIYFTTASGILPQDIYLYNRNDWKNGDFMIGFTITRLWNF